MDVNRYRELDKNPYGKLTEEERKEGWHFCKEWDFLLIHNTHSEFEVCICDLRYKDQYPQESYKTTDEEVEMSELRLDLIGNPTEEQKEKIEKDMLERVSETPSKGDYVLATKYLDGDSKDPWCVGFYDSVLKKANGDRHMVVDKDDNQFRGNGFRYVRKISGELGCYLLKNTPAIEISDMSIFDWYDAFEVKQIAEKIINEHKRIIHYCISSTDEKLPFPICVSGDPANEIRKKGDQTNNIFGVNCKVCIRRYKSKYGQIVKGGDLF